MSTLKEDLIKAREKIEKGWCQDSFARDTDQRPVDATSPEAVSFCVVGAVAATSDNYARSTTALWKTLNAGRYLSNLSTFNDTPGRTQAEVLALFDNTIARLEKEQGA